MLAVFRYNNSEPRLIKDTHTGFFRQKKASWEPGKMSLNIQGTLQIYFYIFCGGHQAYRHCFVLTEVPSTVRVSPEPYVDYKRPLNQDWTVVS